MGLREGNDKIFSVDHQRFEEQALQTFQLQYLHNNVYRSYADALGTKISAINTLEQIPFLPIRFFKSHAVRTGEFQPALNFESSGTTGSINSRHDVVPLLSKFNAG